MLAPKWMYANGGRTGAAFTRIPCGELKGAWSSRPGAGGGEPHAWDRGANVCCWGSEAPLTLPCVGGTERSKTSLE